MSTHIVHRIPYFCIINSNKHAVNNVWSVHSVSAKQIRATLKCKGCKMKRVIYIDWKMIVQSKMYGKKNVDRLQFFSISNFLNWNFLIHIEMKIIHWRIEHNLSKLWSIIKCMHSRIQSHINIIILCGFLCGDSEVHLRFIHTFCLILVSEQ